MIEILFKKDKSENFTYFKITGHSPSTLGKSGENILCAAVSVLVQTLLLFFQKTEGVNIIKMDKGFLEFKLLKNGKDTNLATEVIILGILDLQKQYPELINFLIELDRS